MSIDLTGKVYKDMSKQYRDAVSREDFKKERRSQNRKAGEVFGADTFPDGAPIMDPDEDNIYSYNTAAFGAGSGKETERLSRADIKNLYNQGYSKADIVDYAENIGETGVITDGAKAQKLLDRYKKSLAKKQPGDEDDLSDIEPIDPITPIEDTDPTPVGPPETQIIENNSGDQSLTFPGIAPPTVGVGDFIPSLGTNQSNSLLQSIIQDNDINSQIAGNGNVTTINQDNSASNYGGNMYNFARIPGYYS